MKRYFVSSGALHDHYPHSSVVLQKDAIAAIEAAREEGRAEGRSEGEAAQKEACIKTLWAYKARWQGDMRWFKDHDNAEDAHDQSIRVHAVDALLKALER